MMHRLFLFAASAVCLFAQGAQNPLPNSELKDPAGQKVLFRFHTLPNSVQSYTCRQASGNLAWTGPDPDAILTDSSRKLTVHHYKGPTWEATDGSLVRSDGAQAKHFLPTNWEAVHWLELPAKGASGQFATVTYIHRIDTVGGVAPTTPCDAQHAGDQQRVAYSATYLFFGPR